MNPVPWHESRLRFAWRLVFHVLVKISRQLLLVGRQQSTSLVRRTVEYRAEFAKCHVETGEGCVPSETRPIQNHVIHNATYRREQSLLIDANITPTVVMELNKIVNKKHAWFSV